MTEPNSNWYKSDKFYAFVKIFSKSRNLAIIFTIASFISVFTTYLAITSGDNPFGTDNKNTLILIIIDLVFLLTLMVVIAKRLVVLITQRRKGSVGSRLQTRIVVMFSLVAIIPSIIMAVFSLIFFNYGIQTWFDKKVVTAIDGSVEIARLYLEEHKKIIGADALGMARDLNRAAHIIRKNPNSFSNKLSILAGIRKIPEAIVFQPHNDRKNILARTNLSFSLELTLEQLAEKDIEQASDGQVVIITNENDDRVVGLLRLENFFDTYLIVGRFVDANIMNHIETTEGAANEYTRLKAGISSLEVKLFIIFLTVSVLLLLVVIWVGLIFAFNLVKPVSALISATEKVKKGDFSASVLEGHKNDEIATLSRAFNDMTKQLEYQRKELISAQRRSAWSDVARRIAHEIKNPLTPIQLATDRLKRKYSDNVNDKDMFNKYINTISKNINSIGNMVEEFSNFARIPQPIFKDNNICEIVGEAVFAREGKKTKITLEKPGYPIILNCDSNQISQIMINLIKNAEESIDETEQKNGIISVSIFKSEESCHIKIRDNGKGFQDSMLERLTEPYVTTKSKGTGLGLAIVKKIVEDHNGKLEFTNLSEGASVNLSLPLL